MEYRLLVKRKILRSPVDAENFNQYISVVIQQILCYGGKFAKTLGPNITSVSAWNINQALDHLNTPPQHDVTA